MAKELSVRQLQVMTLAAEGLLDKEIAAVMTVSPCSVHSHWERIRFKLGAKNKANALAILFRSGHLK